MSERDHFGTNGVFPLEKSAWTHLVGKMAWRSALELRNFGYGVIFVSWAARSPN